MRHVIDPGEPVPERRSRRRAEALGPEKALACVDLEKMRTVLTSAKPQLVEFKRSYRETHPE